jgi:hypothetical protein
MATQHAKFQVKHCSDGPGNPKTVSGFRCAALLLILPADACTASKGLLMGSDGERVRGWCRIVACLSQP